MNHRTKSGVVAFRTLLPLLGVGCVWGCSGPESVAAETSEGTAAMAPHPPQATADLDGNSYVLTAGDDAAAPITPEPTAPPAADIGISAKELATHPGSNSNRCPKASQGKSPTSGSFTPGQFHYNFWKPPSSKLWDRMEASITVNNISDTNQFIFYEIDAWFKDKRDPFYMGLQPHGNLPGGGYGPMAVFSFFGKGATPKHKNCFSGADDGSGVSCHVAYPWTVGRKYLFEIRLQTTDAKTETWAGAVTDTTANVKTEIGAWAIPISHGLVGVSPQNFTEYYQAVPSCAAVGTGSVTYGAVVGYNGEKKYPTTFDGKTTGTCGETFCFDTTASSSTLWY